MYIMYTCVLREETNCYAAHYYSTFNITSVAPSSFFFLIPFLIYFLFHSPFWVYFTIRRTDRVSSFFYYFAKKYNHRKTMIITWYFERKKGTIFEHDAAIRNASYSILLDATHFNMFRSLNTSTNQICVLISRIFDRKRFYIPYTKSIILYQCVQLERSSNS